MKTWCPLCLLERGFRGISGRAASLKNRKNNGKNWQKTEFLLQLLLLSPTHQTLESFYTSAVLTTLPLLCYAPTLTRTHSQTSHHLPPAALIATEIRPTGASARGSSVRGGVAWTVRVGGLQSGPTPLLKHKSCFPHQKYIFERGNSKWRWKTDRIRRICSDLCCLESHCDVAGCVIVSLCEALHNAIKMCLHAL